MTIHHHLPVDHPLGYNKSFVYTLAEPPTSLVSDNFSYFLSSSYVILLLLSFHVVYRHPFEWVFRRTCDLAGRTIRYWLLFHVFARPAGWRAQVGGKGRGAGRTAACMHHHVVAEGHLALMTRA